MRNRKLLIGIITVTCVLWVIIIAAGWWAYSLFTGAGTGIAGLPGNELPNELREARIVHGRELLVREQFFKTDYFAEALRGVKGIYRIEDIKAGELDPHPGVDVVIAGRHGAIVTDQNGAKQSQIRYEFEKEEYGSGPFRSSLEQTSLGNIEIIDIEGDGVCEYMGRGSTDGAAVFDHQGKRLWAYGKFTKEKTSIDDMAAGDLDGDGTVEFVTEWESVELFDRYGKRKWEQPWGRVFYKSEVVDTEGDGKNEIVQSTGRELVIRDARGQIIRKVQMPFYLSHFSLCAAPGKENSPHILAVKDGYVSLIDFNGRVAAKFDAPLSAGVYKAEGVWVKLAQDKPKYLAVITQFATGDRSVLYIYSPDGALVYQEVLPEQCSAIAALPKDQTGAQELLVGGSETVWRYKAR
jgi:hypothetical protein